MSWLEKNTARESPTKVERQVNEESWEGKETWMKEEEGEAFDGKEKNEEKTHGFELKAEWLRRERE